ncbi:hypothetical protein REPUB_Repub09cG0179900 [Reevesia pubescens]
MHDLLIIAAYGSFTLVEAFSDKLLSWFTYYYHFKFAFLVWLQLPSTEVSSKSWGYANIQEPPASFLVDTHQARVDELMGFAYADMARFISRHQEEFKFVRIMFSKIRGSDEQNTASLFASFLTSTASC